ncbi:MAG: hypothetical protein H8D38_01635 [DPANN group archaeon]|nr:hypothetical protein [DPANN group archaeon]
MGITYIFEVTFLILLVLGVIFSLVLDNLFLQSVTIFIFGIISATLQELKRAELNFPYILLIVGFVLGYLLATKPGYKFLILIIFFLGLIAGVFFKRWIRKYIETTK